MDCLQYPLSIHTNKAAEAKAAGENVRLLGRLLRYKLAPAPRSDRLATSRPFRYHVFSNPSTFIDQMADATSSPKATVTGDKSKSASPNRSKTASPAGGLSPGSTREEVLAATIEVDDAVIIHPRQFHRTTLT